VEDVELSLGAGHPDHEREEQRDLVLLSVLSLGATADRTVHRRSNIAQNDSKPGDLLLVVIAGHLHCYKVRKPTSAPPFLCFKKIIKAEGTHQSQWRFGNQ